MNTRKDLEITKQLIENLDRNIRTADVSEEERKIFREYREFLANQKQLLEHKQGLNQ